MSTFCMDGMMTEVQSRTDGRGPRSLQSVSGFTLLELMVVVGLISGLAFLLLGSLAGGSRAMSLQSAQATVANLITAARTKAPAINRKCRLLLNTDPGQPTRYLRYLVLQVARQPGSNPTDWDTVQTTTLPSETFVAPSTLGGLVANAAEWKRVSNPGGDLASDLFTNQALNYAMDGEADLQLWTGLMFTPNHTLAALSSGPPPKGSIVIASGRVRTPGTFPDGQPPVELVNPRGVRGLLLSAYGVPALLNDRTAF